MAAHAVGWHRLRRLQLRARLARPCAHARRLHRDGTPRFHDAWQLMHPDRAHDPTVGLYDTVQWPCRFACDFVFVSDDLAPRVTALMVDGSSNASDHQAAALTLG